MAITTRTDIFAMDAIRGLSNSTKELSKIYAQLSSGSRINKASDDAAGLAIASRLNSDVRVYNQGIRNISDGITALQIASEALSVLQDITIRRQELAEQSANGTYSNAQRASLNQEFHQLSQEFQRIVATTEFNNVNLFDKDNGLNGLSLQLGYSSLKMEFGDLFEDMKTVGVYSVGYSAVNSTNQLAASTSGGYAMDVALGDLNNDGILDMVVSDYGTAEQCFADGYSNTVSVSMGNGDGTFGPATFYELGVGTRVHNVSLADINNDGSLDIVADTAQNDVVYTLKNRGNGTFIAGTTFDPNVSVLNAVATGDINGDGNQDLVISVRMASSGYGIIAELGDGNGNFTQNASMTAIPAAASKIEVGDINGDGKDDVLTANRTNKSFSVLTSNGSGVLNTAVTYNVGESVGDIAMGDLDGDGKKDVAVAAGDNVYVYKQNTNGTFSHVKTLNAGKTVTSVEIGDVNGDGNLDIVSAQGGDSSVTIFMGDGANNYTRQKAAAGNAPVALALGDLNSDGKMDAVIANSKGSTATAIIAGEVYLDVATQESAQETLGTLQNILDVVTSAQGKAGALESRLETSFQVMQVAKENYSAAYASITDIDVAEATAKAVKQSVLRDISSSLFAHANLQSDVVSQLLGVLNNNSRSRY